MKRRGGVGLQARAGISIFRAPEVRSIPAEVESTRDFRSHISASTARCVDDGGQQLACDNLTQENQQASLLVFFLADWIGVAHLDAYLRSSFGLCCLFFAFVSVSVTEASI